MRVVLAQLEDTELVSQEEHRVQIYPASVKVPTVADAERRIDEKARAEKIKRNKGRALKDVAGLLIRTPPMETLRPWKRSPPMTSSPGRASTGGSFEASARRSRTSGSSTTTSTSRPTSTWASHEAAKSASPRQAKRRKPSLDVLREEAPDDEALNEHATELRLRLCAERVRERTERPTLPE